MPAQTTNTTYKRLRILGDDEIEVLCGRPRFTDDERRAYFSLSATEKALLEQLPSTTSRIDCLRQLGYCKARSRFVVFDLQEVMEDARYRQAQYCPGLQCTDLHSTQVTRLRQQRFILALYHSRHCSAHERQQWATQAPPAARVDSKPVYIFRELMHSLATQRIVSPASSVMPDMVGKARTDEPHRLTALLRRPLGPSETPALKVLLEEAQGL